MFHFHSLLIQLFFFCDEVHLVEIPVRLVLFYQLLTDEQAVAFQKALLLMRSCCILIPEN
jgi:hypothetical protein